MRSRLAMLMLLAGAPTGALAATSTYDDLGAVIQLANQPCGYVTSFEKNGDNDWVAHCAVHQTYRVFVDAQGRVQVVKR